MQPLERRRLRLLRREVLRKRLATLRRRENELGRATSFQNCVAVIAVQVHEFVDWVSIWEEVQDARQQLRQVYRPY